MRELKYDYLLPIGSIVKIKESTRKFMIIGVLQKGKAIPDKTFDYVAVPYPEGLHDYRLNIGFDQADIEDTVFKGYEDKERRGFLIMLEAVENKIKQNKN